MDRFYAYNRHGSISYIVNQMLQKNASDVFESYKDKRTFNNRCFETDPEWSSKLDILLSSEESLFMLKSLNQSQVLMLYTFFVDVILYNTNLLSDTRLYLLFDRFYKNISPSIFPIYYTKEPFSKHHYLKNIYEVLSSFSSPDCSEHENVFETPEELPYHLIYCFYCRYIGGLLATPEETIKTGKLILPEKCIAPCPPITLKEVFETSFFSYYISRLSQKSNIQKELKWIKIMFRNAGNCPNNNGLLYNIPLGSFYNTQSVVDVLYNNKNFVDLCKYVKNEFPSLTNELSLKVY